MKPNKLFTFSLIATMALLLVLGCKKDKNNVIIDDENPIPSEIIKEQNNRLSKVVGTATEKLFLHGNILDEAGNPLSGATVKAGGETQTTDNDGYFVLQEISLNKEFAVIYAEKQGYFRGIRTFTPTQDAVNTIEFVLQRKGTAKTLNATNGGQLNYNENVILDFPKGSIADAEGKTYSGEVKVYARYIDPRADNFASAMPGNLVGLRTNNELAGMISYGMAGVEITDGSGRPLQVANGKSVKVTMPAILNAPDKMPIWHFNEQYGIWVQTGEVQKIDNQYSFEANHFSTWNLDVFVEDNVKFSTVQIQNQNGGNIANQRVDIYTEDFSNRLRTVNTNHNGEFNLMYAPKEIGLRVVFGCENIDKAIRLTNNASSKITINDGNRDKAYQIGGVVKDCEEEIYSNAYFSFQGLQNLKINFSGKTDSDGKYNVSKVLCDITNGQKEAVVATVFIGTSTIKRDTLNLVFNGQVLIKDINLCESEEEEFSNPYLNPNLSYGSVTDIDGNKYATIQIGNQVWMAENLKTSRYNDGTPIPNVTNKEEWGNLTTGAYAYYNSDASHNATYGKLYNWYAVNTGKLCPKGWHIPTDAEWTQLKNYLGSNAGGKLKATGNTTDGTGLWRSPNSGATNESGFSGLPGGFRDYDGTFDNVGDYGYWWSSTEYSADYAWARDLIYSFSNVGSYGPSKEGGLSCRCARD